MGDEAVNDENSQARGKKPREPPTASDSEQKKVALPRRQPSCEFAGVLTADGVQLKPKDPESCMETLEGLTRTERWFWGKRMGLLGWLTGDRDEDRGDE